MTASSPPGRAAADGPGGFVPPPYPYSRLAAVAAVAETHPGGMVDLSVGTPCDPPPDAVVAALEKQIEKLDRQIRDLIDADDDFRDLDRLLRTVPGVGPTLAATLLADVPELGKTQRQQISAVVGV